jgi:hypothetical protein
VHHRSFLAASTAAATALSVSPTAASLRVGSADIDRLQAALDELSATEQRSGGSSNVEALALTQAQIAVNLMNHGHATARVRREIYTIAANATLAAAWAALDSRAMNAHSATSNAHSPWRDSAAIRL